MKNMHLKINSTMTFKKTYLFLFFFIALIGCGNSQSEKTEGDFKNYFFQPEWFEKPKIYVYEFKSTASTDNYNVYRYFEKIDDNKLKHTVYDKDFNQILIVIYEYQADKVIITELTSIETWNNHRQVIEKVTENVVFDYHKMNEDFGFIHSSRFKGYSDVTRYVTRNIKKIEKDNYNGDEINILLADGTTKAIVKVDSEYVTSINNEKLIYAENIGVIHQETKNPSVEVVADLTSIISVEEFDLMKNAR